MTLSLKYFVLISLCSLPPLIAGNTSIPSTIGVTYNPTAQQKPERVVAALQVMKINAVRIPEPDPAVVRAFSYSSISLLLSVPNDMVTAFATNRSSVLLWLYTHVVPFHPRARISIVSVGTDVLRTPSDLSDTLLPAMRNLHVCLQDLGIHNIIVSTTFTFTSIMDKAFPPSTAQFAEPVSELIIKPLLQFLDETNSSFLINLYPYTVYKLNSDIPIGYALFQEQPFSFRDDVFTGVRYRNLFDMMVDAVISAMAVAGHENIPIIVTETGWPSRDEVDANEFFAETYISGLMNHLKSGVGTPLRKEGVAETYIYELFDREDSNWGLLYPNMTNKYQMVFSASDETGGGLIETVIEIMSMTISFLLLL